MGAGLVSLQARLVVLEYPKRGTRRMHRARLPTCFLSSFALSPHMKHQFVQYSTLLDVNVYSFVTLQFLVVGAHPSHTPHHKLGEPLQGKNMLQIWAVNLTPSK